MLNDPTRRFAYNANKARPGIARAVSTSVEVGSPPPKAKETTSVTSHQFRMLEHDVEKSAIDTEKLQYSFEQMRKEMDALILELKSEVSRREDLQRKLDERALTPSAPESSAN